LGPCGAETQAAAAAAEPQRDYTIPASETMRLTRRPIYRQPRSPPSPEFLARIKTSRITRPDAAV